MFCNCRALAVVLNVGDAFSSAGSPAPIAAAVGLIQPLLLPLLGRAHEFKALVLALCGLIRAFVCAGLVDLLNGALLLGLLVLIGVARHSRPVLRPAASLRRDLPAIAVPQSKRPPAIAPTVPPIKLPTAMGPPTALTLQ